MNEYVSPHKKIVVLGEFGSGKSELAINLAIQAKRKTGEAVCFFDLDQTKPMFRAREVLQTLTAAGVSFHAEEQFMDAPTVPAGIKESLADQNLWTVMDVGGSSHGACCMGQFAEAVNASDAIVYYTINPFRAFSDTTDRILETMNTVCGCAGLFQIHIVCNPFFGPSTTGKDIIDGVTRLKRLLAPLEKEIFLSAVPDFVWDEVHERLPVQTIKIHSYLRRITKI